MAALNIDNLWPHLAPRSQLMAGPGWVALDTPCEVTSLRHAPVRGGGDVLTRLERSRGLAPGTAHDAGWTLVFDAIGGGKRAQGPHAARASGVVVVAEGPAVAEGLGAIERQGGVRIEVVVAVRDFPVRPGPARAGLVQGLGALGLEVGVLRARGQRVLLVVSLASGADTDVPGALGRLGFPVAGDLRRRRDKGDASDPLRLLLHRRAVIFSGKRLEAPLPEAFDCWLEGARPSLDLLLEQALLRRYPLARGGGTDAFRLFDLEGEVTIDRYGADLVVSSYASLPAPRSEPAALAAVVAEERGRARAIGERLGATRVFLKIRPRQANTVVDAVGAGLVPREAVYGPDTGGDRALMHEDGLRYQLRLGDGLSTGIFLDQRDNRAWVRGHCEGLRVLNTFAYTCAFQVAAAAGGARRTVSIDAAGPALAIGRENLALNGLDDPERHDLIRGDVFNWLPRLARRGDRFDVIILDPPSYAKVGKRRFAAQRDYADLVFVALSLLAPGGSLLACVNHSRIGRRRLHQMLLRACQRAGRALRRFRHIDPALDHPGGRMKSILAEIA